MAMQFRPATKAKARLRLALMGPSGSGKTYTALSVAMGIGGRVAVIDSERGSASKYADQFSFDAMDLDSFSPQTYVDAIHAAEAAGYDVLVIDSLSHAWMGKEGALEQVDKIAARSKAGNNFTAWREVTPMQTALVDAMIRSPCHIIATMRVKTEWVLEENERGKKVPRKVGMQPVQRDAIEYEFDVVGDLDAAKLLITKTRYSKIDGQAIVKPGEAFGRELAAWLSDGVPAKEPAKPKLVPAANPAAEPSAYEKLAILLRESDTASFPHALETIKNATLGDDQRAALRTLAARRQQELGWKPQPKKMLVQDETGGDDPPPPSDDDAPF